MSGENERCCGNPVGGTIGEGKGKSKLPEGLGRNPEAENGLLKEVGEQARDLEHSEKQSRLRAE
jgi:hypothetical protein